MTIIFLVFCGICLYKMKYCDNNVDYLSRDQTQRINGIFVFLIFLSHLSSYLDKSAVTNTLYSDIRFFLSQLVVTTFLFYSGYGLFESFKIKGKEYIDKLPIRFFKLLLRFDVCVLLFLIVAICLNIPLTLNQILYSFVAWEGIGNSYWYVFVMLSLYFVLYISFLISNYKKLNSVVCFTIGALLLIVIFNGVGKDAAWYNTIFSFVAGVWLSYCKEWFEKIIEKKKNYIIGFILVLCCFLFMHYFRFESLIAYELMGVFFCLLIVFLSHKIYNANPVLKFLGIHTFSIYMLQRIPMIIGEYIGLNNNLPLFFLFTLLVTLFIACSFDFIVNKLERKIFKF